LLRDLVTVFAHAVLISLIPLLPVSAAFDLEDPHPPQPPVEQDRTSAVYITAGFGAPLGLVGLEGVHRLGSVFEVAGGLGVGDSASSLQPNPGLRREVQWAVMPRLRIGDSRGAFTIGAGISGGNYVSFPSCPGFDDCPPPPTISALRYFVWSNFEIGGEWWLPGGFALRAFGGFADGWCVSASCLSAQAAFPYLGGGVGYAF
jgi:hypothetical protein